MFVVNKSGIAKVILRLQNTSTQETVKVSSKPAQLFSRYKIVSKSEKRWGLLVGAKNKIMLYFSII